MNSAQTISITGISTITGIEDGLMLVKANAMISLNR